MSKVGLRYELTGEKLGDFIHSVTTAPHPSLVHLPPHSSDLQVLLFALPDKQVATLGQSPGQEYTMYNQ